MEDNKKYDTLVIMTHDSLKKLDLLNNAEWGYVENLDAISEEEDFQATVSSIKSFCTNLKDTSKVSREYE